MNDFSKRVTLMRKAKKLSQSQLAQMVGITQPFMSEIEKGRKKPSIEVLEKLCHVLECSADYLLGITKDRDYLLMKEDSLPSELQGKGITLEVLQEVADRNLTNDEIKLALQLAEVMKNGKNEPV